VSGCRASLAGIAARGLRAGSSSLTLRGATSGMPSGERLLVNYWYAHNVGHTLEGLRYCLGYKTANPEMRVSLLLNERSPVVLARLCPFIEQVYPVESGFMTVCNDPREALRALPREWDWIVENHRAREDAHQSFAGFKAFFDAAHEHFLPRHPTGIAGAEPPAYVRHRQLRLDPPADAREAAARRVGGERLAISVVLAGSSVDRHLYPSAASWELILSELRRRHPGSAFCLIGKLDEDGRTTSRLARADLDRLLAAVPGAIDCFDLPLYEQLALLERSALLISPHTGFSFLASTVGTPWLAISGGNWHEYFFNGEPVYSLLPDPSRYPTFAWAALGDAPLAVIEADEDGEGPRTPSMSIARIREDLPELLDAAERLIAGKLAYEDALRAYFPRLLAAYDGDRSKIFSFDDIHRDFI
jgi:hypothetical protein